MVTSFEREVKHRASIKANAHVSEDTVLTRAFKYQDLGDAGKVNKRQFVDAVINLGVFSFGRDVGFVPSGYRQGVRVLRSE